jgi:hypothetical protein
MEFAQGLRGRKLTSESTTYAAELVFSTSQIKSAVAVEMQLLRTNIRTVKTYFHSNNLI